MIDSESPPIRTAPLARLAATRRLERATSMPFAAGRRPAARSAGPRSTAIRKRSARPRGGRFGLSAAPDQSEHAEHGDHQQQAEQDAAGERDAAEGQRDQLDDPEPDEQQ